jgi:hypothetical protein
MHGEKRNTCRILIRKHQGKRVLRIARHIQEDNIKLGLKENWVHRCEMNSSGSG